MSYQGFCSKRNYHDTPSKRHCRHFYSYTRNRKKNENTNALRNYEYDVNSWARKSKTRLRKHCKNLMLVLSNPIILHSGLDGMTGKKKWLDSRNSQNTKNEPHKKFYNEPVRFMWENLRNIGDEIKKDIFTPGDYNQIKIPKIGKSGFRFIEVPPFETRIVARAILRILEPILDPDFYQFSIGFRPGYSINHGLAIASEMYAMGHTHWVNVDIRNAFGSVPLDRLFEILKSRLYDSPIIPFVRKINGKKRKTGLTQGVPTSPFLLNIYLDHFLDQWWIKKMGVGQNYVRYADDIAIFCKTKDEAISIYRTLSERMKVIGLPIKESETEAIKSLESGETVDWLGFHAKKVGNKLKFQLGESAWEKLEQRLAESKIKKKVPYLTLEDDDMTIEIIDSWLIQKAPGIDISKVGQAMNRINQLIAKYSLNKEKFLDLAYVKAIWEQGISLNYDAFNTVHNLINNLQSN